MPAKKCSDERDHPRENSFSTLKPGPIETNSPVDQTHKNITILKEKLINNKLKEIPPQNSNIIQNQEPKLYPLKPLHVRIQNYFNKRKEIFSNEGVVKLPETSKKISRCREKFKFRHKQKKSIAESKVTVEEVSSRPFAQVKIGGETLFGLLDSGASISCLGKNALSNVEKLQIPVKHYTNIVKTADGNEQQIVGYIRADINFNGAKRNILLYLVPNLQQELYLGWDFWQAFDLISPKLHLVGSNENKKNCSIDELSTEDKIVLQNSNHSQQMRMHNLTQDQKLKLKEAIEQFPSFETLGLGKTHLMEHSIDTGNAVPIKQRHYPISPAVQKIMYAEIERLLDLGVIEESESEWSSPMVLIRKGTKNRLCLDSRKLNMVTKKDAYPLPHIEGLLSRLGDTYFISGIDLKDAFFQIPLEKSAKEKMRVLNTRSPVIPV